MNSAEAGSSDANGASSRGYCGKHERIDRGDSQSVYSGKPVELSYRSGRDLGEDMTNGVGLSFLLMIGLLAVSVPVVAHHGNASYGHAKQLTLKGTVTEWDWLSPHTLLKMDVKDDQGTVVNWIVEWSAPSSLINYGTVSYTHLTLPTICSV